MARIINGQSIKKGFKAAPRSPLELAKSIPDTLKKVGQLGEAGLSMADSAGRSKAADMQMSMLGKNKHGVVDKAKMARTKDMMGMAMGTVDMPGVSQKVADTFNIIRDIEISHASAPFTKLDPIEAVLNDAGLNKENATLVFQLLENGKFHDSANLVKEMMKIKLFK